MGMPCIMHGLKNMNMVLTLLVTTLCVGPFISVMGAPLPTTTNLPLSPGGLVHHVIRVNGSVGVNEEHDCVNEAAMGNDNVIFRSIGPTPWSVNHELVTSESICPEPLQSLCGDEGGEEYTSPFFEGDIVLGADARRMIEETIAAEKQRRELVKARRKQKQAEMASNDVNGGVEPVDNIPEVTHNVPVSGPTGDGGNPGTSDRRVYVTSSRTGSGTGVQWSRQEGVQSSGGGRRVHTSTSYVQSGGRVVQTDGGTYRETTGGGYRTVQGGRVVQTGAGSQRRPIGGGYQTFSRTSYIQTAGRHKRALVKPKQFRWEDGVVPYTIDDRLPADYKLIIRMAMKHWERRTCVDFVDKQKKHKDYIRFAFYPGCWSYIGKQGGEQILSVGFSCNTMRTVVHEIGHAVGLWHEQSRRDRDKYIRIIKTNISPGTEENFDRVDIVNITSLGFPYDFDSVMHYDGVAFSKNGAPTIKVRNGYRDIPTTDLGMNDRLSDIDVAQVNAMYECNQRNEEEECFESEAGDGREYRGEINYTEDFITCQKWSALWPNAHEQYSDKPRKNEKNGLGEHNYCRNPEGKRERPWCFTNNKKIRWQYCPVTLC